MATTLTWYTDANYVLPTYSTAGDIYRSTLWTLKSFLLQQIVGINNGTNGTAPATAAWTCIGSSDGTTSNMTGTDLWGTSYTAAKLVFAAAGTAHSWMVLKSPNAIASNGPYYLLIDCASATAGQVVVRMSLSAFTGGSTTAAPTNAASTLFGSSTAAYISGDTTTTSASYAHITRTADGGFYFISGRQGFSLTGCLFAVVPLGGIASNDQWKVWGVWANASPDSWSSWRLCARSYNLSVSGDGNNAPVYPYAVSAAVTGIAGVNSATGQYDAYQVGALTNVASSTGYRGTFPDLYAIGTGRTAGDIVPSTGAQEYVCTPTIMLPFNCALNL